MSPSCRTAVGFFAVAAIYNSAMDACASKTCAYTPDRLDADAFGYNARGEVVAATVAGNVEEHEYDGIGNSTIAAFNGVTNCYQALCEKLMSLDIAKFDALPDQPQFRRFFVRAVPHKKYPDCYVAKFGSENNVRAKEIGSKSYFYMPNYVVYSLLKHFGIDPKRVTIRI